MRLLIALGVSACAIATGAAEQVPAGVSCGLDVQNIQPTFSPDGSAVVFVSGGNGGCSNFGRLLLAPGGGGQPRDLLPAPAVASQPRFSPDGTSILAAVSEDFSSRSAVAIVSLAGVRRDLIAGTSPSWSADGAEVAFTPTGQHGEVWAIRTDGTGLRRIGSGSDPIWSPDGRFIAVREPGGAVAVVRADGSAHSRLADRAYYHPVVWDPQGQRLAFLAGDGDQVGVVDVEGGSARGYRVPAGAFPIAWSAGGGAIALRGGARLDLESGAISRAFGHWDVRAVTRDWSRAAVSVAAGRYFAYEGNDLYVAEPLGAGARLVSPRRCLAVRWCVEGNDAANTLRAARSSSWPNSWLRGLAGHDSLTGSSGFDRIEGGFGDDLILGGAGNDHLFGDVGRDRIFGGGGNDYVDGGAGDDVLASGSGRGRIYAGPGNDRIDARLGRRTAVYCGDGADSVRANATTRIAADCESVERGIRR